MRPLRGFSNKPTRGSTKYANKIANRKSVSVSRAAYRKANAKAKMSVVHRIRTVFGSQTLLSMVHLRPFTHGKERRTGSRESRIAISPFRAVSIPDVILGTGSANDRHQGHRNSATGEAGAGRLPAICPQAKCT